MLTFLDALALISKPTKPSPTVLMEDCEDCQGTGNGAPYSRDPQEQLEWDCATCHGEGKVPATCQDCGGDNPAVAVVDNGRTRVCAECLARTNNEEN